MINYLLTDQALASLRIETVTVRIADTVNQDDQALASLRIETCTSLRTRSMQLDQALASLRIETS